MDSEELKKIIHEEMKNRTPIERTFVQKYSPIFGVSFSMTLILSTGLMGYAVLENDGETHGKEISILKVQKADRYTMDLQFENLKYRHVEDKKDSVKAIDKVDKKLDKIFDSIQKLSREIPRHPSSTP